MVSAFKLGMYSTGYKAQVNVAAVDQQEQSSFVYLSKTISGATIVSEKFGRDKRIQISYPKLNPVCKKENDSSFVPSIPNAQE